MLYYTHPTLWTASGKEHAPSVNVKRIAILPIELPDLAPRPLLPPKLRSISRDPVIGCAS